MTIRELFEHARTNYNDDMNPIVKSSWKNANLEDESLEDESHWDFTGVKPLYIWTELFVYQFVQCCINCGYEVPPHFVVSPRNPSDSDFKL